MFPKKGFQIGSYTLMFEVGSGGYASVWRAIHNLTNVEVAVKIIEKCTISEDNQIRLKREINLHRRLDHPFIASLFDVLENSDFYFIIIELAEKGNFLDYINGMGKVPESLAQHYFVQLMFVLDYLHLSQNIAHRDIKCENILLDKYGNLKLIDFGLCHDFSPENNLMGTPCGSPPYAAPEIIKGQMYTEATDIWSVGIFLYAMVSGHLPFDAPTNSILMQRILYNDPAFSEELSPEVVDLLSQLLNKNETKRITTKEIKVHSWFLKSEYDALCNFTWMSNFDVDNLDEVIVGKLVASGYNCDKLLELLQKKELSDMTAAYRMLLKAKINSLWGTSIITPNKSLGRPFNLPPICKTVQMRILSQKEKAEITSNNQRAYIFAPKVVSTSPNKDIMKVSYPKAQSNLLLKKPINAQRRMSKPLINRPAIIHA